MKSEFNAIYCGVLEAEKNHAVSLVNKISPAQAALRLSVRTMNKGTNSYIAARRTIRANRQILRWANKAIKRFYNYIDEHHMYY